ncbi:hypothetical protein BG74_05795 [Sodalis-like endosymbiont of Proechinophthirus fluctus]|nr:hypothetical protein BG74_05795 [Sodalis-like endosymbiont of Proechinophthirus fluctus]
MMVRALSRIGSVTVFVPAVRARRQRARHQRTGLGLVIVQRIIDAHTGKLEIGRSARQGLRVHAYFLLLVVLMDQGASVSKAAGKSAD